MCVCAGVGGVDGVHMGGAWCACVRHDVSRRVARLAIGGFPDGPIWDKQLRSSRCYRA